MALPIPARAQMALPEAGNRTGCPGLIPHKDMKYMLFQ